MRFTTSAIIAASAFVGSVSAHSRVATLWVNGADQGLGAGVYIRQPPTNDPIKDLNSADLACNVGGKTAASKTVTVKAGDKVEPEWFHNTRGDDILDPSHKGPIVAYLAKASTNGEGKVWSKIAEDGYDGSQWATSRMIANKGKHSVNIPSNLADGDYILRVEFLALHESDTLHSQNSARGIQLYPSCSQITVTGGGSGELPAAGVAFPGAYTDSTPGILFNLYGADPKSYVIPGPAVVTLGSGSGSSPAPATSSAAPKPTTSAAAPTSAAPEPTTSAVAPKPTTSAVAPASSAPASSAAPKPTTVPTSSVKPTTAAPKPTTSAVAPKPTTVETSVVAVPTTSAKPNPPAKPTTSSAASSPAPTPVTDANECWRIYNKCLDASQPHPDFTGCSASRDTCVSSVNVRRSGTLGRRMI